MWKGVSFFQSIAFVISFIVIAVVGFLAGSIYMAGPDQTALSIITWDGVAAGMTLTGALATFVAAGVALEIAGSERSERNAKQDSRTRAFAILVRAEISTLQAQVVHARALIRERLHGSERLRASWGDFIESLPKLELPVTQRLLEHALDLNPDVIKPTFSATAMIDQLYILISRRLGADRLIDDEELRAFYHDTHMLLMGLQLIANEVHDQVWRLSGTKLAIPAVAGREVDLAGC